MLRCPGGSKLYLDPAKTMTPETKNSFPLPRVSINPRNSNHLSDMTIDSGWLHAFKEEVPEAFTARAPFRPRAVFVDGQVR